MSEILAVHIQPEAQENTTKSLAEQREDLCLRLQLNRRLLAHKLIGPERENHFPRSSTMRFLSSQSTHQIIKKAANAALGLQTFRSLHYGYTAIKFIRNIFKHKNP